MNRLLDNPIARMNGPDFLLLYGAMIMLLLVGCRWLLPHGASDAERVGARGKAPALNRGGTAARIFAALGILAIAGLGGYKLTAALLAGHRHVNFLVYIGLAGVFGLIELAFSSEGNGSN